MPSERFFIVDQQLSEGDLVSVGKDEAHHLFRVVRARPGDEVTLLDGKGGIYRAVIRSGGAIGGLRKGSDVTAEILSVERAEPLYAVDIAIPMIKMNRMDFAVEKCAEIGVRRIIPFHSTRSVWKGDEGEGLKKCKRLRRKVAAACKQSGNPWFTEIEDIITFEALPAVMGSYGMNCLADACGEPVSSLINRQNGFPGSNDRGGGPMEILGIVGPEGGFTDSEKESIVAAGAVEISLGLNRLRSETSAFLLASMMILWKKSIGI
jgi:16S rRNA (uracil1498-N3)-methyltransferase